MWNQFLGEGKELIMEKFLDPPWKKIHMDLVLLNNFKIWKR